MSDGLWTEMWRLTVIKRQKSRKLCSCVRVSPHGLYAVSHPNATFRMDPCQPPSSPMDIKRIKRKPPPSLHWTERYPPPDPTDPFAPLWVLRNRSSTLLSPTSFTLYPDNNNTDVETPLAPTKPIKESHYRRRSQSFFPESDDDSVKAARILPSKPSFASLKRGRKISISGPGPILSDTDLHPKLQSPLDYHRRPIKTFDLKPAPELDPGFVSDFLKEGTPTSSTQSHSSSSFINISAPSPDNVSLYSSTHTPREEHSNAHTPRVFPFRRFGNSKQKLSSQSHTQPEWQLPTEAQLSQASALPVVTQSGIRVPFGSLFANQRTIVIFIRHFWCPLCQDYIACLTSLVDRTRLCQIKDPLTNQAVDLVVLSNGSHTLIQKYKQIFGMDYQMYTDPNCAVYDALGMSKTYELACTPTAAKPPKPARSPYVRRGPIGGLTMVVLRALRVGMPVWERGGDMRQLGGEFVFGPGLRCTYAHRMQTPQGHSSILDILDAAGTAFKQSSPLSIVSPTPSMEMLPQSFPSPLTRQTHKRTEKNRMRAASRSVLDIPSSDSEASFTWKKRQSMNIPQIIRTSATWSDGLSSFSSDEFGSLALGRKRRSVCGALSLDDHDRRRSLSLAVSVAVKTQDEQDSNRNDLMVLFDDNKDE